MPTEVKRQWQRLRSRREFLVACNWLTTLIEAGCGFVIAPALIRSLGADTYGTWIVLSAAVSYFLLLDMGIRSAIGRQIAFHHARNDGEVTGVVTAGLLAMGSVALVAGGLLYGFRPAWIQVLGLSPAMVQPATIALAFMAVNLGLSLLFQVFDGALWAFSRFDLLALVDGPAAVTRTGLTVAAAWYAPAADRLPALAGALLVVTVASGIAKVALAINQCGQLRPRPRAVRRHHFGQLLDYGRWNFLLAASRSAKVQSLPILVARGLGVGAVTPYSIARRLHDYSHQVIWTSTGTVTPQCARRFATNGAPGLIDIMIVGGRWCFSVALLIAIGVAAFGGPFITLWIGGSLAGSASAVLWLLVLGEFLAMWQSATGSVLLGMSKHKALGLIAVLEATLTIPAVIYCAPHGLLYVAAAIAVPQAVCSGVLTLVFGCRAIDCSIWRYIRETALATTLAALPTAGVASAFALFTTHWTWPRLCLAVAATATAHLATSHRFVIPRRAAGDAPVTRTAETCVAGAAA